MSPAKIPSKAIDKSKYRIYFNKARDFNRGMRRALDEENWNSAGLEAVHCVISATDALLAYAGGIRCTSQDHGDAAQLLTEVTLVKETIRTPEAAKNSGHFLRVIEMKNIVEYEARNFTSKEAGDVAKHVERDPSTPLRACFAWVKSFLPA